MTPHRFNDRGTFVLDRQFPGIGRVRRASGTTDRRTFRAINAMLSECYAIGRHDLLRALRDKQLSPMTLYATYREQGLSALPAADTFRPLEQAWTKWSAGRDVSAEQRRTDAKALRRLTRGAGDLTISALADRVLQIRSKYEASRQPVAFNRTRAAAMAFLRDTFGRRHPLYGAVQAIPSLQVKRSPHKAKREPLTVAQVHAIASRLPADRAAMVWTLCASGMNPKEYWVDGWTVGAYALEVRGEKRAGRRRLVPLLLDRKVYVAPACAQRTLNKALAAIASGDVPHVTLYAFRHTFAHWLELAGIPRTRRRLYRGHGKQDIGDEYEGHEVARFVREDGAMFAAWLKNELRALPTHLPTHDARSPHQSLGTSGG